MTDGERRFEYKSDILINELYQFLLNIGGDCEETVAPDYYDEWIDYDVSNFYLMGAEISFMESEGSGGAVVRQFKTYYLTFPAEGFEDKTLHGTDLGMQLLCDVTNGIWYKVPGDDLAKSLSDMFAGDYEEYLIP